MKKFTFRMRLRQERIRKKKIKRIKKNRRNNLTFRKNKSQKTRITLPDRIHLTDNESCITHVIKRIRKKIADGKKKIHLNFHDVKKISATGMILLLAEIRNSINTSGIKFSGTRPEHQKAAQVLVQIGLNKLLHTNISVTPRDSDVVHWKFSRGNSVRGESFDKLNLIELTKADESSKLYSGLIEASGNCVDHAYPKGSSFDEVNVSTKEQWWAFSQLQQNRVCVVFCDIGVGIPETLRKKTTGFLSKFAEFFTGLTDAEVIHEAISGFSTRTGEESRGNGLYTIANYIKNNARAKLIIYSHKGVLAIENKKVNTYNRNDPVNGTIICWEVDSIIQKEQKQEVLQ